MAKKGKSQNRKKRYESYKANKQREKNKLKKLEKYLKTHPSDQVALKRIGELKVLLKI